MDYALLFDKIGLWELGRNRFYELQSRRADPTFSRAVEEAICAYDESDSAFEAYLDTFSAQEGIPAEELTLYIYLLLSERMLKSCRALGMDDGHFYETALAFFSCCKYLYDRTGIYGISRWPHREWFRRYLSNKIYRLGRLEFELIESPYSVQLGEHCLREGTPCLSVHIPRYAPLNEEECEKSYQQAKAFFKQFYGMDTCFFYCSSWLLHPWIGVCLPDGAIANFQSKFTLVAVEEDENSIRHMMGNVFLHPDVPLAELPQDTRIRRLIKERLENGAPLGKAHGYRL